MRHRWKFHIKRAGQWEHPGRQLHRFHHTTTFFGQCERLQHCTRSGCHQLCGCGGSRLWHSVKKGTDRFRFQSLGRCHLQVAGYRPGSGPSGAGSGGSGHRCFRYAGSFRFSARAGAIFYLGGQPATVCCRRRADQHRQLFAIGFWRSAGQCPFQHQSFGY